MPRYYYSLVHVVESRVESSRAVPCYCYYIMRLIIAMHSVSLKLSYRVHIIFLHCATATGAGAAREEHLCQHHIVNNNVDDDDNNNKKNNNNMTEWMNGRKKLYREVVSWWNISELKHDQIFADWTIKSGCTHCNLEGHKN